MILRFRPRILPQLLFLGGSSLLGYCAFVVCDSWWFQQHASAAFEQVVIEPIATDAPTPVGEIYGSLGRLAIPRLGLSVMVLEGTTAATLRRAAGHITGTALPGTAGNAGISAHRDTFFYPLRNARLNDRVSFTSRTGMFVYRVVSVTVVQPADTAILAAGDSEAITLVTCYPFTFVGSAPERYVVRAERVI